MDIEFEAPLWEWHGGKASWFFVSLPAGLASDIRFASAGRPRAGFGSVKVTVRIGRQTWRTSLFPDKASGSYLLPIKKSVRAGESLGAGDNACVALTLVDI